MPLAVKVDEDLPVEVAETLRAAGHDAVSVLDQGLPGARDSDLWESVQHEHRVMLTADKGFANAREYQPGSHAGVILFRLPHESRKGYIGLAEHLVATTELDDMAGSIVVVSPDAIRVHRSR